MIDGLSGERLPAIDLAHVDLSGGEQRPEQHGRGVCRGQHGLRLDPTLELLVQPLDRVGGANAAPLARRQPREGEEPIAGLRKAVRNSTMLEPPFADERLAPLLDLLARRRVDHVVVVGRDLFAQPLGPMRQQVAVLVPSSERDRWPWRWPVTAGAASEPPLDGFARRQ